MQLEIIIQALRERCPSLAGRVGGAAQFRLLPENASLPVPCAYVIPLDDNPGEARSQNAVRQPLTDSFAVVVALSNTADERGQTGMQSVRAMRSELWAALLGWQPSDEYDGITYEGGSVVALDRARLWYQFDFGAAMEIGPEDGWQDRALVGLPHFDGVNFRADFLDPSDPNVATPGPDGRIEIEFSVPKDPDAALE